MYILRLLIVKLDFMFKLWYENLVKLSRNVLYDTFVWNPSNVTVILSNLAARSHLQILYFKRNSRGGIFILNNKIAEKKNFLFNYNFPSKFTTVNNHWLLYNGSGYPFSERYVCMFILKLLLNRFMCYRKTINQLLSGNEIRHGICSASLYWWRPLLDDMKH